MTTDPVLTENAISVLRARYLIKDAQGNVVETPRQLFERVALAIAEPEPADKRAEVAEDFYEMMARRDFLPNTPCLVNAGRPGGTGQLSACFVIPVPDSMDGIFEAVKQMALVHKTGGGTGFSFSRLRPAGSTVGTTSGVASGPVSFMIPFDSTTQVTKQGGVRRGANMGVLRVDHPDIMQFVRMKLDPSVLQNFNVSVGITDAFMTALATNQEYDLVDPSTQRTVRSMLAREVWDEIIRCAHLIGDPGLIFLDRVNALDPLSDSLGAIEATNPCVPGDVRILTRNGWVEIADVVGKSVDVWNGEEWSSVVPMETGRNQTIVKVTLSDGHTLRCTPRHTFYLADETPVAARDLRPGDVLERLGFTPPTESGHTLSDGAQAYLQGFYQGDGCWNDGKQQHEINFYGAAKIAIAEELERQGLIRLQPYSESQDRRRGMINRDIVVLPKGETPDLNVFYALPWLAGLLDSDGNVVSNGPNSYGYQVSSVNRDFLAEVQMLLRRLGVPSALALMKDAEAKVMPGGEYDCQPCWRITIAASSARRLQAMGLKTRRLPCSDNEPARAAHRFPVVVSVEPDGWADTVYCFTEPKRHRGVFDGVLTGQCGEVPLRAHDACTLGSINLSNFVSGTNFDLSGLRSTVRTAVRFLDNVLTVCKYPVQEIYDVTRASRKIGLGVMGWADALIKLGIPYDSLLARELGADVMRMISDHAVQASVHLATERGPFEAWPVSKWAKQGRLPRRNATCTVIAPTGTISIIAGCSSGIEPLYALSMTRNQAGMIMTEVNPLVCELAEREGFASPALDDLVQTTGSIADAMWVPENWRAVLVTANEISMPGHVLMQAAFQRYTEDGVSKTVNLRRAATVDDVRAAYELAWENGCKGITVYRDGCREGQVLVAGTAPGPAAAAAVMPAVVEGLELAAVRRIPADGRRQGITISRATPYGTAHVTINVHPSDGKPFEVFARLGKGGSEANAWTEALGRTISYVLSNPSSVPVDARLDAIAQQLAGIGGGSALGLGAEQVVSAPDAIAKVLLDYLYGGEGAPTAVAPERQVRRDICPSCGHATLTYSAKCGECHNCGFSKC